MCWQTFEKVVQTIETNEISKIALGVCLLGSGWRFQRYSDTAQLNMRTFHQ